MREINRKTAIKFARRERVVCWAAVGFLFYSCLCMLCVTSVDKRRRQRRRRRCAEQRRQHRDTHNFPTPERTNNWTERTASGRNWYRALAHADRGSGAGSRRRALPQPKRVSRGFVRAQACVRVRACVRKHAHCMPSYTCVSREKRTLVAGECSTADSLALSQRAPIAERSTRETKEVKLASRALQRVTMVATVRGTYTACTCKTSQPAIVCCVRLCSTSLLVAWRCLEIYILKLFAPSPVRIMALRGPDLSLARASMPGA